MLAVNNGIITQLAIVAIYLQEFINCSGQPMLCKYDIGIIFLNKTIIAQLNKFIYT
ncbi:MAG: hypothetical protein J1G07_02755 [Clostridiales bacterium]|nr:hypothetical protein [Clostridiales bacterium]